MTKESERIHVPWGGDKGLEIHGGRRNYGDVNSEVENEEQEEASDQFCKSRSCRFRWEWRMRSKILEFENFVFGFIIIRYFKCVKKLSFNG